MRKILLSAFIVMSFATVWGQNKLSPYTRLYLENATKAKQSAEVSKVGPKYAVKTDKENGKTFISAFIHLNEGYSPEILEEYGVIVRTVINNMMTTDIPVDAIEKIAALEGVKYIEMGAPVEKKMDEARKDTKVNEIHSGTDLPEEYRGKGVVVGVVDNGFEFGHPAFYTRDKGESRIKRFWDQNGSGTSPEGFGYGNEYTTSESILAKAYDSNTATHGTHVLGIAAGADNTDNKNLYGVATDADIVLVAVNGNEFINGDNTTVIDAIKYIFDYAESENKPCVVNLSLGSHLGPRDGSSTFDQMLDALVGPGRIVVGACGNDGDSKCHVKKQFKGGEKDTLATFVDFKYTYPQYGTAEVWGDQGMELTFVPFIYSAENNKIHKVYDPVQLSDNTFKDKVYEFNLNDDFVRGTISVKGEINPINQKPHLMLTFDLFNSPGYYKGFYLISENSGDVNMWTENIYSYFNNYGLNGYIDGNDQSTMGEIGGTAKRIISVGAYVTRDHRTEYGIYYPSGEKQDDVASFSSLGPTADGRTKPEISAPGTYIISSLSSVYSGSKYKYCTVTWNDKKYEYGYMQGTSMASPFITGVMATWLQAYPDMTPEDAKKIMSATARQDSFTGDLTTISNTWGYGKIDAYEGIKECIKYESGINSENSKNSHAIINNGNEIRIMYGFEDSEINISLYNLQGVCVNSINIDNVSAGQETCISTDRLDNNIYLMKISGNKTQPTVKKVIVK